MHVYFDTSVYDHIEKRDGVTEAEVAALQLAVDRTDITIYFGLHNAEELSGQWEDEQTRPAAICRLRVAASLTRGFRFLLKASRDLLDETIAAYAGDQSTPSPMLPDPLRTVATRLLRWAASGTPDPNGALNGLMSSMLENVRRAKQNFIEPLKPEGEGLAKVERLVRAAVDPENPRFEDLWQSQAGRWALEFANQRGIGDECMNRGLEGLVELRPLRLAVGTGMSLAFSAVIEKRRWRRNDGYDLWHTVSAAPADVFVTFDGDLKYALDRVPITEFRVLSSLHGLLALLADRSRHRGPPLPRP